MELQTKQKSEAEKGFLLERRIISGKAKLQKISLQNQESNRKRRNTRDFFIPKQIENSLPMNRNRAYRGVRCSRARECRIVTIWGNPYTSLYAVRLGTGASLEH